VFTLTFLWAMLRLLSNYSREALYLFPYSFTASATITLYITAGDTNDYVSALSPLNQHPLLLLVRCPHITT